NLAIERGINFIDAVIVEERILPPLADALESHREEVLIAGHLLPPFKPTAARIATCEKECHDFLAALRTDYTDVLILSAVDSAKDYRDVCAPDGVLELARRLVEQGKVRFLGAGTHIVTPALNIVESNQLDVLMHDAGICVWPGPEAGLERDELFLACASRGLGVIAKKTFSGGAVFSEQKPVTIPQCIAYSLSRPGVATVLVGVKDAAELEADLAYLDATDEERDFSAVAEEFLELREGACLYCNHCLPCPAGIDVGATLRLSATARHGGAGELGQSYDALPAKASDCVECGDCVKRCPYGVETIEQMQEAAALFES
ncbi:MAG: aldo/keto reductase, partial [Planctomycetota bacterium]